MYIPHQAHKEKKKKRRNKMMRTPPLPQNKMIWGALRIGSVLNNACSLYAVGTDAEAEQVNKYFGKVAVSYPPPLVLNVEPVSDSHRFLELVITTAGGHFSCHLWNHVVRALRGGERVLLRMPSVGGGTT